MCECRLKLCGYSLIWAVRGYGGHCWAGAMVSQGCRRLLMSRDLRGLAQEVVTGGRGAWIRSILVLIELIGLLFTALTCD